MCIAEAARPEFLLRFLSLSFFFRRFYGRKAAVAGGGGSRSPVTAGQPRHRGGNGGHPLWHSSRASVSFEDTPTSTQRNKTLFPSFERMFFAGKSSFRSRELNLERPRSPTFREPFCPDFALTIGDEV